MLGYTFSFEVHQEQDTVTAVTTKQQLILDETITFTSNYLTLLLQFTFDILPSRTTMSKPGAIKINLGAKKATAKDGQSTNNPRKPASDSPQPRKPRAKFSLTGDEDDDEEPEGKSVEVTHFDEEKGGAHNVGAQNLPKVTQERIIECQPNRNWRDEATRKRQKSTLPGHSQGGNAVGDDQDGVMVAGNMKYGLNTKPNSKPKHKQTLSGDSDWSLISKTDSDDGVLVPRLDEHQLRRQPKVPNIGAAFDEEGAYEDYVERAPDAPSFSDYEKVPVEGFGLAMLKGMGFKETDDKKDGGKDKKGETAPVKRRPALLGIGAKPMEAEEKKQ